MFGGNSLDEAVGTFFHIQASYEVIATGEKIDFDFIQSCYNREVVGSFSGVLFSREMTKATKDGAAISIAPPDYYCPRTFSGLPYQTEKDVILMPLLAWYKDVNDLSFATVYVTNDAYLSPHAKVKFISYSAEPTDRKSFNTWMEKAEAEYVQIGAIPGPFSCSYTDVSKEDEYACFNAKNTEGSGGKGYAFPGRYIRVSRDIPGLDGFGREIRKALEYDGDYYCPAMIDPRTGKPMERELRVVHGQKYEDKTFKYPELVKIYGNARLDEKYFGVYLNPNQLLSGTNSKSIISVYPIVFHENPTDNREEGESMVGLSADRAVVTQIIRKPDWKGFGFIYDNGPITEVMPLFDDPAYRGLGQNALYINEKKVCEFKYNDGGRQAVYDLRNEIKIKLNSGL